MSLTSLKIQEACQNKDSDVINYDEADLTTHNPRYQAKKYLFLLILIVLEYQIIIQRIQTWHLIQGKCNLAIISLSI